MTRSAASAPGTGRALRRQRHAENFPVAMRLLPRRLRLDLIAIYEVARTIDDLGDEAPGDREARLTAFADDLGRVWEGSAPKHPVLRALVPVARRRGLDPVPFHQLVQANLRDQRVTRYSTHADLLGYCALSADPIGRLVLAVFGVRAPGAVALSDRVCTALQLIEHWQDVAEDYGAGRVYLPQADLAAFGVAEPELGRSPASPALRGLILFEVRRTSALLESGAPLVGRLRGWARIAVAGYVAGGRAAIDAVRRADGDVVSRLVRGRRRDLLRHLVVLLCRSGERGAG
ncbi:squalene synthase HpnC [Allokutzneria oryzae]|uniref:Squalene synthase HpnC n=1 Tax=Allokutzneria oryzae TaxID=1378989 RepID=A0ABV5ZYG9_9PSEU